MNKPGITFEGGQKVEGDIKVDASERTEAGRDVGGWGSGGCIVVLLVIQLIAVTVGFVLWWIYA